MNHLGEKIKSLRTAKRMTQQEFADRLHIAKSTVSAYENGSRVPSYDILLKIARVFKVSVDHLLGYSSKLTIDVTGLTQKQINVIQDIVATYQRHNALYRTMKEDDSAMDAFHAMGFSEEEEADWLK